MNKRGISPLIATVLLIGMTIVIAATVATFLINKTKQFDPSEVLADSEFCDQVNLGINFKARTDDDILSFDSMGDNNYLTKGIIIKNKGSFSVHKLYATFPGGSQAEYDITTGRANTILNLEGSRYSEGPLMPSQSVEVRFVINPCLEEKNIGLIPIIQDPDKEQFVACSKKELIFDYNELCVSLGADSCSPLTSCSSDADEADLVAGGGRDLGGIGRSGGPRLAG